MPGKVNLLLWRVRLGRLPTKRNLIRRGVDLSSDSCPLCHSAPESEDHLFLHCSTGKEIRASIKTWCSKFPFISASLIEFLDLGRDNISINARDLILEAVIAAYYWSIWNLRNSLIFRNKGTPVNIIASEVLANSFLWVKNRSKRGETLTWYKWSCNLVVVS